MILGPQAAEQGIFRALVKCSVLEKSWQMDEKDFLREMERIQEDIEDFPRPLSPCVYFHGREKLFGETQLRKAIELFLESQQRKFEGRQKVLGTRRSEEDGS